MSEIAIPFARNELIKKLYTNGFINQVQFSRKSFADTQEPGKYKSAAQPEMHDFLPSLKDIKGIRINYLDAERRKNLKR